MTPARKAGRLSMAWLYNYFMALQANLWLVPAAYCVFFMAATVGLYFAEMSYTDALQGTISLFQGEAADAKSVVETLLSAMITMATLAISITIVVLSLAASQLGPRLIKSVMSDRRTKDFIGMFFGAIVACFVLTVILHSRQPEQPVPQITIAFVFLVVFVNLFVLLGFVHHIARSCIADSVINRVARELDASISRLAKDEGDAPEDDEKLTGANALPDGFEESGVALNASKSGYIQQIDYRTVVSLAVDADAAVRIDVSAGYYAIAGEAIGWVHGAGEGEEAADLARAMAVAVTIDTARTPTQDIQYSVRHMVEIALRALSPGINDSYTAIQVIDQLAAALACLFTKRVPDERHFDDSGVLRLLAKRTGTEEVVFNAFDRIRHAGCGKPDIAHHLLAKLKTLSGFAREEAVCAALNEQVEAIEQDLDLVTAKIVNRDEIGALASDTSEILRKRAGE